MYAATDGDESPKRSVHHDITKTAATRIALKRAGRCCRCGHVMMRQQLSQVLYIVESYITGHSHIVSFESSMFLAVCFP